MSLGDASVDIKFNVNGRPTTGFGSVHRGGTNLLFADGQVRFVGENVNSRTYRQLSVIDDGLAHSCF